MRFVIDREDSKSQRMFGVAFGWDTNGNPIRYGAVVMFWTWGWFIGWSSE